ncbi:MAG: glycosyltransferase family 4 protein [Bacteroidota bacterium]|nr:glycosyltransferase family 4 protein [Bacteroidota bacterium]MDP4250580.1 glycosyltransferase family 4 protein [Bacteroidota bacterium]
MTENEPVRQKKKIALVANSAWSVYNFRLDLIRHLIPHYHVLVIAPSDEFTIELTREGCGFLDIEFNNRSENPFQDYALYRSLKRIYREQKPDFIFHYVIKPNIYGSLAAAACGIESVAVVTGLGYAFARQNWLNKTVSYLYKRALKRTKEVWFLNKEDAEIFIQRKLVDGLKVKILPGEGINPEHFAPAFRPVARTKAFQFLMSTRLLKSKGVRIYVDAARILLKRNRDIRFELIGFFEEHHPDSITEADIRYWQRKGVIHYSGFAKDVRPFLRQADCLVFPSFYSEGVPRCLMEAAAMEIPIITSLNRGCKEVVESGVNGYLCAVNDAEDLARKMEAMILLSATERAAMGKKGRELVVAKFDVQKILVEYDRALAHI